MTDTIIKKILKASDDYIHKRVYEDDCGYTGDVQPAFVEGAEWGYNQAEQDLMDKAVEVEVSDDWQYGKDADRIAQPAIKLRCPELKIGQKVKVIIIKE